MEEILNSLVDHETTQQEVKVWYKAAPITDFPLDGGACVKYKDMQIAVFNFESGRSWYACQNLCPHKLEMILSRGLTGTTGDEPKVSCPFHKRSFSLKSGACLNAEETSISIFPVKIENDHVYIGFAQ